MTTSKFSMKKIYFKGQRSNRTPMSYPEYKKLFQRTIEYSLKPEDADFLIYSCFMDIQDDGKEIQRIFAQRPDIRLVILSEEPLWDSLWSKDCFSKKGSIQIGNHIYPYTYLNHWTTRIYDFEKIPYFITTCDDYFARYAFYFIRNSAFTKRDLKKLWQTAPNQIAFYAEFQDQPQFDIYFPEFDVWGLCRYRTLIAQGINIDGVVRIGKRWGNTVVRQLLPDWHLDKLAGLDKRSIMVSGIENTHQWNYVSEKIFDAFATLGVPLYFAGSYHEASCIVPPGSFLNLYGLSVDDAIEKICSFRPDSEFIDTYCAAQSMLADTFSQPEFLVQERFRVVSEVISELSRI
jgi:hypothetical protein